MVDSAAPAAEIVNGTTWLQVLQLVMAGGLVGAAGSVLTLRQRRRHMAALARDAEASADGRIMAAAAALVEQAAAQVPLLIERITRLEADRDRLVLELTRLRTEQDAERAELSEWRTWGARQREWSIQAVQAIRRFGGEISDPPSPPRSFAAS
jgi:hypothetical protein